MTNWNDEGVYSSAMFDESYYQYSPINLNDYSPSTWTEALQVGVPTVTFALFAITHPIMCLAGTSVALGGSYLYKEGYCMEGETMVQQQEEDQVSASLLDQEPEVGEASDSNKSQTLTSEKSMQEDKPSLEETSDEEDNDEEDELDTSMESQQSSYVLPAPLKETILDRKEFSCLHAMDFFKIFFGDDAPFSFQDFQKQRGDINIVYGKWSSEKMRILNFQTATKSPFCNYATAKKTQRLLHHSTSLVVMESITTLEDIPFCQYFNVQEQWVLQSDINAGRLTVAVTAQLNMVKQPCPFESQIRTKSIQTLQETLVAWCKMAQKAVRVSHQRRQRSFKMNTKPLEISADDAIEVEYTPPPTVVMDDDDDDLDDSPVSNNSNKQQQRRRRSSNKLRKSFKSLKRALTLR